MDEGLDRHAVVSERLAVGAVETAMHNHEVQIGKRRALATDNGAGGKHGSGVRIALGPDRVRHGNDVLGHTRLELTNLTS